MSQTSTNKFDLRLRVEKEPMTRTAATASKRARWAAVALAVTLSAIIVAAQTASPVSPACPRFASTIATPPAAIIHQVSQRAELVAPSASTATGSTRRRAERLVPASTNLIDTYTFKRMQKDGVGPTGQSADSEFLRRVSLDLTGQIPDSATVESFLADTAPDKRDRKIEELLASDAFVDRWTMWFGDLVQNVQVSTNIREYYVGRNAYYQWIHDSIKAAKPYDQMVREVLAGTGDSFAAGTPNYWVRQIQPNGPIQDTYDNLAAESGSQFLGQPLLCTSCHNGFGHLELVNSYLAKKSRYDFWKMAAFFSRTRAEGMQDTINGNNVRKYMVTDNVTGAYQLNTISGNKTPRTPAEGQPSSVTPVYEFTGEAPRAGESYRDAYGRMLTADPQFARATVNYIWKEMFGLGLIEPANNIDLNRLDPTNLPSGKTVQPSDPDLLAALTNWFRANRYDLRGLVHLMASSRTYQLSSTYTPGPWNEAWTTYYARHYPHRLMAEELLDAVFRVTSVGATFNVNGLGSLTRAMTLPDTTEQGPRSQYGQFLNNFGRGDRDQNARSHDSSISQALGLMNDSIVVSRIHQSNASSTVGKLKAVTDPAAIADALYLATLSRHPTPAESQAAVAYLKGGNLGQRTEDLQFVLINSLEFLFD
jgi:Protein of unknown function (DUF1549)/Protein of unknown function (DUF1553)